MPARPLIKKVLLFAGLVILILLAIPTGFLAWHYFKDPSPNFSTRTGYSNDASGLNQEKVTVIAPTQNIDSAISQIASLVQQAKQQGKKISIAGAQHSMGGHTIYPGGIVLDMKTIRQMKLDTSANILCVGAGALWSDVIPYLDKYGRSISVMQSNSSFTVGGSVSVNCHGWQPESPPIASTVESFRLINADGKIIVCSRAENAELFSLALGGYGLFGVIVDVRLKVVQNRMYRVQQYLIDSKDYISYFNRFVKNNSKVGMPYGRINVNPSNFMEEAILSTFTTDESTPVKNIKPGVAPVLRRTVFRSSANSAFGKNLRWRSEKMLSAFVSGKLVPRNQLLNEGVEVFQNTDSLYTDILHEYFIPEPGAQAFIDSLRMIIPGYKVDLLNVTLRNVKTDSDSYLRYAKQDVIGFVLLFNQRKTSQNELEMEQLTRKLIDVSISLEGSYYLPYRLHAQKAQFEIAYPQSAGFFCLKKKYDPSEIFQNKFYLAYR